MTTVELGRYEFRLAEQRAKDMPAYADRALYRSRILVVDDDEDAARLMQRVLERRGFRVVEVATGGREALDLVFDRPPDVVVLDVHMRGIDGLEVVRQIRTVEPAGIPSLTPGVIAVSGDNSTATRRAILAAGADDFVARPCDWTEFALRVLYLADKVLRYRALREYAAELEERMRELARRIEAVGQGSVAPAVDRR
jgi:putative two-component system response regulator